MVQKEWINAGSLFLAKGITKKAAILKLEHQSIGRTPILWRIIPAVIISKKTCSS